jgi:hypothetical protein
MDKLNRDYKIVDSNVQAAIDRYEQFAKEPVKTITDYNRFGPLVVDATRGVLFDKAKKAMVAGDFANQYLSPEYQLSQQGYNDGLNGRALSQFGLPVWDAIQLFSGQDGVYLGIAKVEFTQSRNIVQTAVAGVDGTIKEFISNGDDMMTITATIVGGAADYYPQDEIIFIKSFLDKKEPIKIYGDIVNKVLGQLEVVVTSYKINQPNEGMRNVQQIEIQCLSNNPDLYKIIMFG